MEKSKKILLQIHKAENPDNRYFEDLGVYNDATNQYHTENGIIHDQLDLDKFEYRYIAWETLVDLLNSDEGRYQLIHVPDKFS
jgi:hypothetical protein